jgi:hypothetical protein
VPQDLSDSSVHTAAEPVCLALVGEQLGVTLAPETVRLSDGTTFHLDGVDRGAHVFCEVFSHIGDLKDGQKKKLAKDLLKLLAVEHSVGGAWRKVICVVDAPAQKFLTGASWCAAVAREFRFEVVTAVLSHVQREELLQAQACEAQGMRRNGRKGEPPQRAEP